MESIYDPEKGVTTTTGTIDDLLTLAPEEPTLEEMVRDIHRVVMKISDLVDSVSAEDIGKVANSPMMKMISAFIK